MIKKVSVIMSVYNEPIDWIQKSLDSILNQTYKDIEIIIIVDNPNYPEAVSFLGNKKTETERFMKIFINTQNRGLPFCRNLGVEKSVGYYISIMDADDIADKDKISNQIRKLEEEDYDLIFSDTKIIDENGIFIDSNLKKNSRNTLWNILINKNFVHPTAIGKRSMFLDNKYNINFLKSQDLDLWIRLYSLNYKIGYLNEKLLSYRITRGDEYFYRIKKQREYAKYGALVLIKNFNRLFYRPAYFYAILVQIAYFALAHIPKLLLVKIIMFRDSRRNN